MTKLFSLKLHAAALCAAAALLAGCGGGSDTAATPPTPPTTGNPTVEKPGTEGAPETPASNAGAPGPRVLLVNVDGVRYDTLRRALAANPALAALNIAPAFTGGRNGTLTEQRTSAGPGWASLMTGTWADRHGVAYDSDDQRILTTQAPSIFTLLHGSNPALKSAAISSSALNLELLADDVQSGAITTAVDCAGVATCVTGKGSELVQAGYQLVVAQYAAPANAAETSGMGSADYTSALNDTLAQVGQLTAAVARRQSIDPSENWLVVLTTGFGYDAFGSASGLQASGNKTIFIVSNKALAGMPGAGSEVPDDAQLLTLAAATDIAPTVLRQLGVQPTASAYGFAGMALQSPTQLRQLVAVSGANKRSIDLSWALTGAADAGVQVLRNGQPVATLPAGTSSYNDPLSEAADGTYSYRYAVVAGEAESNLSAQIAYVKPATLAATLRNGLEVYHPLDALPPLDAKGGSTLTPFAADANGATLAADGFLAPYKAQAVRIDSRVRNAAGAGGYRLQMNHDVTADATVAAFTIGFWMRTDDTCSQGVSFGGSVLANKNYDSGSNAGLAIGIFGSCELRFVIGSGSARAENKGAKLSAGQWAYVAMVVDRTGKTLKSYIFDPVLGTQTASVAMTDAIIAKIGGLGTGIVLNEDGTGLYYQRNGAKAPPGALDFNEFAVWNRALTVAELTSLFKSAQPLSTLQP